MRGGWGPKIALPALLSHEGFNFRSPVVGEVETLRVPLCCPPFFRLCISFVICQFILFSVYVENILHRLTFDSSYGVLFWFGVF